MYISFDLEATQAEKIALPVHQRFSLVQGLLLLEQANQEVLYHKTRRHDSLFFIYRKRTRTTYFRSGTFITGQTKGYVRRIT